MALKKQQKKQALANKEANKPKSWPDLPSQLVSIIGRHQTLEKSINFGGVIKSWRAIPKQCKPDSPLPWLQLFDPDAENYSKKYLSHIEQRRARGSTHSSFSFMVWGCWCRSFLRTMPRYPWKQYVGSSNGILVAEGEPLYLYYLWNPIEREWYHLPSWDAKVPFKLAVLSSSPADSNGNFTVMVLTGITHPAFAFHKVKRRSNMEEEPEWTKQDCTLAEPHSPRSSDELRRQQIMQFTNALGFRGKFYALSLQGTLAVIEEVDSSYKITALSATRVAPSVSSSHFREYLLESDGEILLVYLVSRKSSVNIVDGVEVYQLNLATWVKLGCLWDRTVFVGSNSSISVLASKVGCRRNCVYFRHPTADEWWVYDMESGSISPGWSEGNSAEKSPVWIEPIEDE